MEKDNAVKERPFSNAHVIIIFLAQTSHALWQVYVTSFTLSVTYGRRNKEQELSRTLQEKEMILQILLVVTNLWLIIYMCTLYIFIVNGETFFELLETDVKAMVKPLGLVKKIMRISKDISKLIICYRL